MKKIFCLAIILAVFMNVNTFSATKKSSLSKKSSSSQINSEAAQVALKFITEYSSITDNIEYMRNTKLITEKLRSEYFQIFADAYLDDDIVDVDSIIDGQDAPSKYKIISYNSKTGLVVVQGIDWKKQIKLKVKKINGKWLVDGSGMLNMD
jgi:hypothetical protein